MKCKESAVSGCTTSEHSISTPLGQYRSMITTSLLLFTNIRQRYLYMVLASRGGESRDNACSRADHASVSVSLSLVAMICMVQSAFYVSRGMLPGHLSGSKFGWILQSQLWTLVCQTDLK